MANGRGCRPKQCKSCGEPAEIVGMISFRGLCQACRERIMASTAREISAQQGPAYDRWRETMRRAFGD